MSLEIDKRKNTILTLKSIQRNRTKGIDKQIKKLRSISIINICLSVFCNALILLSLISEMLSITIIEWNKVALLTILSISYTITLPIEIYQLKLLKHLKKIADKEGDFNLKELNLELKGIIDKLNNKRGSWFIIVLAFGIMFLGVVQVLSKNLNPYWSYIKLPVLLFYGIVVYQFITINKKLNKNIQETENLLSIPST